MEEKPILKAIGVLVPIFIFVAFFATLHEQNHYGIYLDDGCLNATMSMFKTSCHAVGYVPTVQSTMLHNMNDIVGRPMLIITVLISGMMGLWLSFRSSTDNYIKGKV